MVWKLELYCKALQINHVLKTKMFQTFTLFHLTLLKYLQFWFEIKMPKPKQENAGCLSKSERQICKSCTHRVVLLIGLGAIKWKLSIYQYHMWDFFRIQNFPSKSFFLTTRYFERINAFAPFQTENWCLDLAYVDELARKKTIWSI